ncbi:glycosyltransferase family 2 protein [Paradesertivirga mongoliensis]|uniref:Glycosyltransferase family 2 protein n=1 Tax=Paradesertivirga mongoliensis TaxID=2100740 RepID=A0ABW4ZGH9_9SPHI|nr:glycosyltransferase family 2 protein [Pedobacter mongoliensis]
MIDVSVIIPTYNRLWSLPRAIESCRKNSCSIEIIVVDDGSTDETWQWLQTQENLISLRQDNQGQTYAINAATAIAKGEYIRFLDSDDFLESGIIDRQFLKAKENGAQLIYSRVDNYSESTKTIEKCPDTGFWDDFLEVQLSNRYGSHFLGMLFHRDLVTKVPRRPDFAYREDRMFLLEVGLLEPKTAYVEGCAGYWVQHHDQMQRNYQGLKSQVTNWQHLNIFKKILSNLELTGRLNESRKNAACTVLWMLAHWIAKDHIKEATEVANWIFKLNPTFRIPEQGLLGFLYKTLGFNTTELILRVRRFLKYGWN